MTMRRIAWYGLLSAVALVTAGLQLDKQSAASPALAALVPEIFRSAGQPRIVSAALLGDDARAALAQAERLVVRRPVPAQSLRLLALAQFQAGEIDRGSRSIQYAARRGWRDIAAQEAMARFALGAGDRAEAARRYTALLARGETADATLEQLGPAIFDGPDPAARETMAAIIAGSERWHGLFLRRGPAVMPPESFGAVVIASMERGADYDCAAFERAVETIAARDAQAGARLAGNRPPACERQGA
ncbi:hypothetical protein [Erythrobacter sp. HL-111]|uniref:hypothetical protein n=1 Tax=Erythrobacter sp. HL-111 TaxID=1798193 RepID=UPI0006DAE821|nr:hypothetical protein [Erythrobacter sp. HL-111]KPP94421.1 MAG: hypothetical protein HLUCCO15_04550 [Erythrobacteraceae bacterium HL-111]SDS55904.1 hypothetical protein SAMN04515621_1788 [Erythrobacter sp. HL-111]